MNTDSPVCLSSARPTSDPLSLGVEPRVDVSRLDLRVGRILGARRHPLAEAMSVQEVDLGEDAPRTVVSKLGEKTQVEEVTNNPEMLRLYSQNDTVLFLKYYDFILTVLQINSSKY